jgi:uncharacterized zinc-type alcohol dehydrogenase-like protein
MHCHGYCAPHQGAELVPFEFERRTAGSSDVSIEILHCGVCHSDLSFVDNEWGSAAIRWCLDMRLSGA